MFVDSHAHMEAREFDHDRARVLARAREAGIEAILEICGGFPEAGSFTAGLALVKQYEFIYGAVGIHPHDAKIDNADWESNLLQWSRDPKILGWGEIGLDYYYDHSPREVQRSVFRRQLQLARDADLPVIIHTREAEADTLSILRDEWPEGRPGVFHCFTGSPELAYDAVARGLYISFSGILTFKNAEPLRKLAAELPMERLLIETDAPFLAPVPHRSERNEPMFVIEVARQLAALRGMSLDHIGRVTANNFRTLFRLSHQP